MDYSVIERLMAAKGVTAYRVAKDTGIAFSSFSDWKRGRSSPKPDKLTKLAEYFGVGVDDLLGGGGEGRAGARLVSDSLVPVIGEIRAGSPIITEETLEGYELADLSEGADVRDYFFLRIRGDSMKEIGMVEGAVVLFRKQSYAEDGQIVACLVGGEMATVKRFSRVGRRILLLPENREYSPIELSPVDFETGDARILGVATEIKIKL